MEKLLSELSNDNEYSASKSDVFFFTSNDELQKKMGQTPFNPRLREELSRMQQNGDYGKSPLVGEYTHNSGLDGQNSYSGVTSGEGLPLNVGS